LRPGTVQEAATLLRGLERPVRPVGGGTKPWMPAGDEEPLETGGLDRILEHNVGDFTAVLEAGVPFAEAQATFAEHGQRLAWDPPLGSPPDATIGGIVATADSGPLRHRYGGVRDLVVGTSVVLSDGTIAKSGGKVIKNVAGYDLAKLFAGSFGTLGLIATVAVRLHPLPEKTATVAHAFDDPDALLAKVLELARLPLEADCFDVVWEDGSGRILTQFSGAAADEAAARVGDLVEEDWDAVRALQRRPDGVVLKVSGRPTDLPHVIRAAGPGATVVSRAALGLSWIAFPDAERVAAVRQALSPRACTVLDGAARVVDQWPDAGSSQAVMERLKARFDPARIFRPGTFVGGL
jgi:glycolate oxidase FAD binding subunit